MMIAANQRRRLQFVDQRIRRCKLPVGVRLVPHPVEPDSGDIAVIRQQFRKLRIHKVQIAIEVAALGSARRVSRFAQREIIRIMPIELRMIEKQLNALLAAFFGKLLQRIFRIRRRIDDVPLVLLRREHRETVMMLARDRDVFHPRRFRQRNDLRRIELCRIKLRRELFIFNDGHMVLLHVPFAVRRNAVHAPVNEHPELRVLKPFARLEIRLRRLISLRRNWPVRDDHSKSRRDKRKHNKRHSNDFHILLRPANRPRRAAA